MTPRPVQAANAVVVPRVTVAFTLCDTSPSIFPTQAIAVPYTIHPTSYTLHPTPFTLHPTPYTLHPTPYTLHPTPYTLHPTPYIPSILHPTLFSLREGAGGGEMEVSWERRVW